MGLGGRGIECRHSFAIVPTDEGTERRVRNAGNDRLFGRFGASTHHSQISVGQAIGDFGQSIWQVFL